MFRDRFEAGRRLGKRLFPLSSAEVVVLGLPRGGVPVAFEVATVLGAPLDVVVVRKLGASFQPELAMGAIGEDGAQVLNLEVLALIGVEQSQFAAIAERERTELERRESRYRNGRPRMSLDGQTAVVVDDGIATGSTARVACQVARALGADRVVLAVPVASPSTVAELARDVDDLVCLKTPDSIFRRRRVVLGLLPDDRRGSHRAVREGGRSGYADVSRSTTGLPGHLSEIAVGSDRFAFHRGEMAMP